jgi:hypothetical protein
MIRPVIPGAARPHQPGFAPLVLRRPLSLPTIVAPQSKPHRTRNLAYRTAALDNRGRITYRAILDLLGWTPTTTLVACLQLGRLIVRPDVVGANMITPLGRLCLPLDARRALLLRPGDHVLLAADPVENELTVLPEVLLDRLLDGGDIA